MIPFRKGQELPDVKCCKSISQIEMDLAHLVEQVISEQLGLGCVIQSKDALHRVPSNIAPSVGGGCTTETLQPLFLPIVGEACTKDLSKYLAMQIAAQRSGLRRGNSIKVFNGLGDSVIKVPAVITECFDYTTPKPKLKFTMLAGPPAGCSVTVPISKGACYFVARELGFAKRGLLSWQDPRELVRLKAQVILQANTSEPSKLEALGVGASSSQRRGNKRLICQRQERCCKAQMGQLPCHTCSRGYDTCFRACKPVTNHYVNCPVSVDVTIRKKEVKYE